MLFLILLINTFKVTTSGIKIVCISSFLKPYYMDCMENACEPFLRFGAIYIVLASGLIKFYFISIFILFQFF